MSRRSSTLAPTLGMLALLTATVNAAADALVIATDTWEGYTNADGTGYYIDVINTIYKPLGYSVFPYP